MREGEPHAPPTNRLVVVPGLAVVKLYRQPWRRINELRATELARRNGARVARVLWTSPRPVHQTGFAYAAGPTLAATPTEATLSTALRYLAEVHSIVGPHFGRIAGPSFPTWSSFLRDRLNNYQHVFGLNRLTDPVRVVDALKCLPVPAVPVPRLVHNDPNPTNFIAARRGVTAVDWELAVFGDPTLDIARVTWEWGLTPRDLPMHMSSGHDVDILWYYQAIHTLGRLMSASTSQRPNVALLKRCRRWLASSPWGVRP